MRASKKRDNSSPRNRDDPLPLSLTTCFFLSLFPLFSSQNKKTSNSGPRSRASRSSACTPSRRRSSTRYVDSNHSNKREKGGLEEDETKKKNEEKLNLDPNSQL